MEQWKSITGYEGLYEVSDTGLVRSLKDGNKRILSSRKRRGYLAVDLRRDGKRKTMSVHRLVAAAFIPNPLGLKTVNHRDENKTNNNVSNLEWMTQGDNNRYGTHGLKLLKNLAPPKPVRQLDPLGNIVNRFPSIREAARQTGISDGSICEVCNGGIRKTAGGFSWKYA